jgi:3',5'-cyclic-nucleotide phosphodiesterase
MDLKILGCHGGETPKHRTSSFLLDDRLALDAGALTSMLSLEEQRRISTVLVSHPHMDHVRDLATIADNRCQQGGPPLEIVGIADTVRTLKKHFFNDRLWPDFSKIDTPMGPTIRYRVLRPERTEEVAGYRVTPVLVDHTIDTAGFVIDDGRSSIAYSGDTGPTERLWRLLGAQANLSAVLLEVSFPDAQAELARISGHLTPSMVEGELQKLGKPADLPVLLYHIKPVFERIVHRELARIRGRNLRILELYDQFEV